MNQKRARRAFCALVLFLFVGVGCSRGVSADKWKYQAPPRGEKDNVSTRIDFLEERLKSRPKSFLEMAELAGYYAQRGKERRNKEDIAKAQALVDKSLKEIDNPSALLVKADLLQMTHHFPEALKVLDRVDELEPRNESAQAMRVRIELADGEVEAARKAVKPFEDSPHSNSVFLVGQVLEGEGKVEEARAHYQAAIKGEGDTASASESARRRAVLARLELSQGNLDEAEALLEAAHQIPVEQPLTEILRAELFAKQGRTKEAADLLRAGFEQYRDPLFLVKLGILQQESGDAKSGRATLEAAAQLLRTDSFGHERDLALALFYIDSKANRAEIDKLMAFELGRRHDAETKRIAELVKAK